MDVLNYYLALFDPSGVAVEYFYDALYTAIYLFVPQKTFCPSNFLAWFSANLKPLLTETGSLNSMSSVITGYSNRL